MSRQQFVDIAKRNLEHYRSGTIDQEAGIHRVPAANYHDPTRWRSEMDAIFKRLPLVMGYSAELPEPGTYKALDAGQVPVLLTRAADGEARAFINMCSHRGAIVVPNGSGSGRRFTCPYHAWNYDLSGDLVGIMDRDEFGDIDPDCHGLTPLPTAERAGIIWATVSADATFDIDNFLQGYDELLDLLVLEETTPVGTTTIEGPNWKVAYDGYLDFYHLPILHRESFGSDISNKATYDAWGPHQQLISPSDRAEEYEDREAPDWPNSALHGSVITIFPHVSIASFDAGGKIYVSSQLFPGPDADTSVTVQTFLALGPVDDERLEAVEQITEFLEHVVRDEDYFTGNRIQRSVKTGAKQFVMFGRNEGGGQRFHRWVDALIDTPDEELASLFAAGID